MPEYYSIETVIDPELVAGPNVRASLHDLFGWLTVDEACYPELDASLPRCLETAASEWTYGEPWHVPQHPALGQACVGVRRAPGSDPAAGCELSIDVPSAAVVGPDMERLLEGAAGAMRELMIRLRRVSGDTPVVLLSEAGSYDFGRPDEACFPLAWLGPDHALDSHAVATRRLVRSDLVPQARTGDVWLELPRVWPTDRRADSG